MIYVVGVTPIRAFKFETNVYLYHAFHVLGINSCFLCVTNMYNVAAYVVETEITKLVQIP